MKVMVLGNTECLENAYSMINGLRLLNLDAGYFGYSSPKELVDLGVLWKGRSVVDRLFYAHNCHLLSSLRTHDFGQHRGYRRYQVRGGFSYPAVCRN